MTLLPFSLFRVCRRFHRGCGLAVMALVALASPTAAQPVPFKLDRVEVGFRLYENSSEGGFKAGLWAPVYSTFMKAEDGNLLLTVQKDGVTDNILACAIEDAEGTQGVYHTKLELGAADKSTVLSYVNPGNMYPNPNLTILPGKNQPAASKINVGYKAPGGTGPRALVLDSHLYLTVGSKLTSFEKAIAGMNGMIQGIKARKAAFETEVERLPDAWFGYQAVDLLILTTDNDQFARDFLLPATPQGEKRVAALIEWVRRGGRLVLSVSTKNQDKVHQFLQSPLWQPAFPPLLSASKTEELPLIANVHNWAASKHVFTPEKRLKVAVLQPDKSMKIELFERKEQPTEENQYAPLMVRVPYGLGSVTVVAFELDRQPFTKWEGNIQFWQTLVRELGPKVRAQDDKEAQNIIMGGGAPFQDSDADITTKLHRELDYFNVPMISFGWVALFIFLYILIVGPLDYFILKKVFKRLEWTWVTFPAVVIGISVIAYFTAYALKGDQLKINKVDLIDIDLRTSLDKDYKTKQAYAHGTTWFSLLSPRIQNYTIGVQPALGAAWAGSADANPQLGEVMVTWMGRPDVKDYSGMGKPRSAGLFRRAYEYAEDATGLKEVPIPVWTTKAFIADWEAKLDQPPFVIDLHYKVSDPDQPVRGTIQSNLPVELEDLYLIYGEGYYALDSAPLLGANGGKDATLKIDLSQLTRKDIGTWMAKEIATSSEGQYKGAYNWDKRGTFSPMPLLKQMYFFEKIHTTATGSRNHIHRPLDQSWRLGKFAQGEPNVRTAILVGRLARAEGSSEQLHADNDPRLPSHLWLGELPGNGSRPELTGTITQDTYIRIFVPVRPILSEKQKE